MGAFNFTHTDRSTFILTDIPSLEAAHIWISIPFSTFYIFNLLGNFILLCVLGKEQTLHKQMYLLLCMLALSDIAKPSFVVPRVLSIFWFNLKGITMAGCLTQMFFLHMVSVMHSATLVIMAFDRYVTYATILSNAQIVKLRLCRSDKGCSLHSASAHICVMLTYYTPCLFSNLTYWFGQGIGRHVHIILADLYLLIPPILNPIIYGIRTKELHDKVGKYTSCRR